MAPRQKRKMTFDEHRFVNSKAQATYDSIMQHKKCIQDRIFEKLGGDVERMITEQGWENFCYSTNKAAVEVVKEFYANIGSIAEIPVHVRGFSVEFNASRINSFYELHDQFHCEYKNFGTMENRLEEVINFLTDGKGVWKIKQRVRLNFPLSMMNANSKAWHYFICSTILPTYHHSEVSRERAILNYCIQNNKKIDIGAIIYKNIIATSKSGTSGGLGHPGLIYALCQLSGVEARDNEEWIYPMKPISKMNLKAYEQHEGWRSGVRSSAAPSTSRDIPSTSYDEPSTSGTPTLADVMGELAIQRKSIDKITDILGEMQRESAHDREYLKKHSDFEVAYYDAEARYRRGEPDVDFPECPRYSFYQSAPAAPDPDLDIDWDF